MKRKRILAVAVTVVFIVCGVSFVIWMGFDRARSREHASGVMRAPWFLSAAIDQYALEHDKRSEDKVTREDLLRYQPGHLRNGYLWPYVTPFGDEIELTTVGATLKIPYPSWKRVEDIWPTNSNFWGNPCESEAEYKARMAKTGKR